MKANCYGCSIDHPSQIQHMDGGAMEQMKEIIPLTEDTSPHIQDCFAMQESDLENELLKSNTFAVEDIICKPFKNQC